MSLSISTATRADASALARLRGSTADRLTQLHGRGHWSSPVTEAGVLRAMTSSRILMGRSRGKLVGMLALATKKPWASDASYFTGVERALYLHDMAVAPRAQGRGIGRQMLVAAAEMARAWPAQAIRLDAYDAAAGAGGFYARCGYAEMGHVTYRTVPLVYYELVLG